MVTKKATGKNEATEKVTARKVQFDFIAREAKAVHLLGNFNNWDSQATPLKMNKKGIWGTSVQLKAGRYEYRFLVDDNWENDASCFGCVPNDFGSMNCVRIVE
jgi:1,4-alpha-glucan branching enzyme